VLPPGDLRMAIAALSGRAAGPWAPLLQHRFAGSGALAGHAVGNLLLAGLMEVLGDPVAALDTLGELLGLRGRVLPMSCEPLDIEADVTGLGETPDEEHRIRGQVAVAATPGRVRRVRLRPARPLACPQVLDAVQAADVLLLGPGSWFSSVLPHLLVPELHDALVDTSATKVVILNLVPQPGETAGFSPERHLDVLFEHAPRLRVDAVIADRDSVPTPARLRRAAAALGARAHLASVAAPGAEGRHDPDALASCVREALGLTERREGT
jgi:uncharacterized cofD-like protein